MKAVFWVSTMVLMQISRSRFKPLLIPHIYVLDCFVIFGGIFGYFGG